MKQTEIQDLDTYMVDNIYMYKHPSHYISISHNIIQPQALNYFLFVIQDIKHISIHIYKGGTPFSEKYNNTISIHYYSVII